MKHYCVMYEMHSAAKAKGIHVGADTKEEAYDRAVYEAIPAKEGSLPYSAWVESVTYRNGNYHLFNNFPGKPY